MKNDTLYNLAQGIIMKKLRILINIHILPDSSSEVLYLYLF